MFDRHVALAGRDGDRDDFVGKGTALDGGIRAAQRFDRVFIHLLAGELVLIGGVLREGAHRAAFFVGILQPIEEHVVIGGVVTEPGAAAVLLEKIWRVGHALHSTGHDGLGGPRHDKIVCQHRGFHP